MENKCCFTPADILIPKNIGTKWSVVACDQYTSEKEYWEDVKKTTDGYQSTYNLILPECYLEDDNSKKIMEINNSMSKYLNDNVFDEYKDAFIFVKRTQNDKKVRTGIIGKIDLEAYDYHEGTTAKIRATEKTVVSRIPARVKIRENAPLELPHILLLVDDISNKVLGTVEEESEKLKTVYDFDLMKNGGHIKGKLVNGDLAEKIKELLLEIEKENNGFLFCVGDGNHSLASAKECYNNGGNRYALVEVVNIHDSSIEFEPIYRAVFGADNNKLINAFIDYCGGEYKGSDAQKFTVTDGNNDKIISVKGTGTLPVATLQSFLDEYAKEENFETDYIHGENSLRNICKQKNALGFLFDGMKKGELFTAVNNDGSLPRKTFSMGHAEDKRFYLEARKIK